jgi:hypothetical protein
MPRSDAAVTPIAEQELDSMRLIIRGALLSSCVSLLLAGSAMAQPTAPTLMQTFPFATRLCERAQAQELPQRLQPDAGAVTSACTTLGSAFTINQTTLTTTVQQARASVVTARTQLIPALKLARQDHNRQAALTARAIFRGAVHSAVAQRHAAIRLYITSNQAARIAFWGTIRSLPGGARLHEDPTTPTPVVPPLTTN